MYLKISTLDLATLMYNVYRSDSIFGYNDCDLSMDELIFANNSLVPIKVATLEKFLYCANVLDEQGKFWHHSNKSFNEFMDKTDWPLFDRQLNYFKGVEESDEVE